MAERDWLAERFEEHRSHLRAVAYRMLGSLSEADDAVQEAWIRLSRADAGNVENLGGWLTQVVSRVCLDMLRSRKSRREESLDAPDVVGMNAHADGVDPEQEALLAESVGLAMLVVLETLEPAERLAFVLHDMFAVPFDEIAPIVDRSPAAARQLASRARRRVHGVGGREDGADRREIRARDTDLERQRAVVDAFLAAARGGDFQGLMALLDPDVVLRSDQPGAPKEIRGAKRYARAAATGGAQAAASGAWAAQPALVNGAVGVIVAPRGHLTMALQFTVEDDVIVAIDFIADPARLANLELAVLDLTT